MADRMLFIGWNEPVRGREERALEVFDDAVGILGRMQQEGRIEGFDVCLLAPSPQLGGYMTIRGTQQQIDAMRQDPDFLRNTIDAGLCVDGLTHLEGFTDEGVAQQMTMYREAMQKAMQHT